MYTKCSAHTLIVFMIMCWKYYNIWMFLPYDHQKGIILTIFASPSAQLWNRRVNKSMNNVS